MTDMPPPPPPANVPPPPPPPPAGGGFNSHAAVNQFKGADPLDLAVVGAGVLALLLSFFSFYTASHGSDGSISNGAWHGFWGWAGVLLLLGAAAVTAAKIINVQVPSGALIAAGTAVLGLLCEFIALFAHPGISKDGEHASASLLKGLGADLGHGWAYWIVLILALVSAGVTGLKVAKAKGLIK